MCALIKYDALIIDSDMDTRMRLKQVTSAVPNFGKVFLLNSTKDANTRLATNERCDVMFISHTIEQSEIATFIKGAKQTPAGQDTAYVLVLQSKNQSSSVVAQNVMIGADGLLFEPYSVEQLMEITHLAARVKKERAGAREEAAMKFLVTDIMNHIDLIAFMKSAGYEVGRHMKKLKDICAVFGSLSNESREVYTKVAVDMFEAAPLPKKIFQKKNYAGASSRVKKKMEEKLIAEIERDFEQGKLNSGGEG